MSWPCFIVSLRHHPPEKCADGGMMTHAYFVGADGKIYETNRERAQRHGHLLLVPGAMYLVPRHVVHDGCDLIHVWLPGGRFWCPQRPANNSNRPWVCRGEPPLLTCSPSVDISVYHGWLQNGVLSDDVEGRVYPEVVV